MLSPLNKELAFAAIADELELPLVLLCSPDPHVRLVQLEKIGAALMSTNLTFRDLAERVVAPRPTVAGSIVAASPDTRLVPSSDIRVDRTVVSSDDELQRLSGDRAGPVMNFGHYGSGPIPDECDVIPGESDKEAGERLALWAMAKSGQPFWEDLATGQAALPGVTVPGRGVVRPDGTLGPLPAEE